MYLNWKNDSETRYYFLLDPSRLQPSPVLLLMISVFTFMYLLLLY